MDQHNSLNCKLIASPVFDTSGFHMAEGPCMSQGKLFKTILTAQFFQMTKKSPFTLWIWMPVKHDELYNVCIKVF